MVNYLISQGHRRIGCLSVVDYDVNIGILRKQGYFAALEENNIAIDPSLVITGDFEYISGERGAKALMENPGGLPTAVYCITDRLAIAACGEFLRRGIRVPDDISVACVDDPGLLSFCHPSITTMSFDYQLTGMRAGQMVIDCIDGKKPRSEETVMPFTMQIRESVRAL
jgi:DNA-binding LacI/PurR family transcriptional regulator